jgi:hypothetical protein
MRGRIGRQQAELHLARHCDIALELALLAANGLVEPRIFNRNGNLRAQRSEHTLVLFIEEGWPRVLEIENADDARFIEQRHDQFRARLGIHGQVALVPAHVGDVERAPLAHRCAHESAAGGYPAHGRVRITEAPCVACHERLAFFIEQHDGKHLIVDEPAQQLTDALEQRIQLQD